MTDEPQLAVAVELANITGPEPAIFREEFLAPLFQI